MKKMKVLVIGKLPPPVGGVTIFIKYLLEASKASSKADFFIYKNFLSIFQPYNVVHINFSNPVKRALCVVFFKLFKKKVYFVKHGTTFDINNPFVKISLKYSNGIFCLNDKVFEQLLHAGMNALQHSTVFSENITAIKENKGKINDKCSDVTRILFYINNNKKICGEEVYGASFFARSIYKIKESKIVKIVDLSKSYQALFDGIDDVTYSPYPIDFIEELKRTDIYVRCTSMDGMSVALLEAGLCGVKCLASDSAPRPSFVNTYKHGNMESFVKEMEYLCAARSRQVKLQLSSIDEVINFMDK